ncbi:uroporphyrinogen-III C-methyltransferase [Gloeobacter kilaueensis]|uniref:uroporphyrinogen-III C-methyltransferase n=1 Tax=Gloeobacter kilaueensis (strain ATCC BAA-2537 / CCAP 1431/1 / ULC 316 / JS1) TaxID=1183438 RepID=U5QQ49_GLOK1|nr:uroporphyrinogen-III C-methyltransferase [Gloeobacter kilaueensis]AGY59769.1 uroporphyrin-III C-methyltransferase [Gloeobacter kilaueensis JS1]
MTGRVFVVGAGPAGAACLTVRAQAVLAVADVVFYDELIEPDLRQIAPAAEWISVGWRAGRAATDPAETGRLLVEHWRAGRSVVRLKAGDPLVFGRAVAELEVLHQAGCAFELVPGVSSALAAPLFAGIPITDTALSSHFCVLTGHDFETLPWQALARIDTLIILMGMRRLGAIAERLMDLGRPAAMPVAVIFWAGRPEQHTIVGTLETIADLAGSTADPAVIVVGPVVRYRERFGWSERRALSGYRILVTRAADQASSFSAQLSERGAAVVELPALVVTAPTSWQGLDRAIENLRNYRWLLLTSANGVNAFFDRLAHHYLDLRALADTRVAVVGPRTAQVARARGLMPDFMPGEFVADSLLADFPEPQKLAGEQVLFVRVESGGREAITAQFRQWGALVDEVAGYATGCPEQVDPAALAALKSGSIDYVTFASAKTVRHFARLLGGENLEDLLKTVRLASIGPQTSIACREVLGRVDLEAKVFTLDGLIHAIEADAGSAASGDG